MDLFGDVDTRRASSAWTCIGEPVAMRLDAKRTLAALEALAREPQVLGWVAGAGFEALPDVLEQGAKIVPLIGNPPTVIAAVREPIAFFRTLDTLGMPHPEVSAVGPDAPAGWLVKDARGSGAWHIRPATSEDVRRSDGAAGVYYQREAPGKSYGVLFVANGEQAQVIGCNEQTIRPRHGHPYVYCGMVGPVSVGDDVARRLDAAVQALVAHFGLTGLNSLDVLLDGDAFQVLEVNSRPSSSVALFDAAYERGLVHAHVEAHLHGTLPAAPPAREPTLRGDEIVFADRTCIASAAMVDRLLASGWAHDIPHPETRFTAGEPVCTVSVQASSRAELRHLVATRRDEVTAWLQAR